MSWSVFTESANSISTYLIRVTEQRALGPVEQINKLFKHTTSQVFSFIYLTTVVRGAIL